MQLEIIKNGDVVDVIRSGGSFRIRDELLTILNVQLDTEIPGHTIRQYVPPEPEPAPPTVEDYRAAIQAMLDNAARSRLYDNGLSLSTYVNSTNPVWAAEAAAFVAWRDAVWAYAYTELAKVEAELRPIPTVEDFLAELPTITWPE